MKPGWPPPLAPLLLLLCSCAGAAAARRSDNLALSSAAWAGWRALVEGSSTRAFTHFREAQRISPDDAAALFGLHALAFERGQSDLALDAALALLDLPERKPQDPWALRLASAAATRLADLLTEASDPRRFEDRLLALRTGSLSWRARLLVEQATDGIARRRGDAQLLRRADLRQGCLRQVAWVGNTGRFPHLDLAATPDPSSLLSIPLEVSGCVLTLPERDSLPGIRLLRSDLAIRSRRVLVVLEYGGPALVRMDGGGFVPHGSDQQFGPRMSAVTFDLAPGRHNLELRIGSYGGAAQLRAYLFDPAPPEPPPLRGARAEQDAAAQLADALSGDAAGETERALAAATALRGRRRFSLGLATAATIFSRDPTRPPALARAEAESLYRSALTQDPALARVALALARAELDRDRSVEAIELARQASQATPAFWPAATVQIEALRARGLESQADQMLQQALGRLGPGEGACELLLLAHQRAQIRYQTEAEQSLVDRLRRCDARSMIPIEWLRRRGDLPESASALQRRLDFVMDRSGTRAELAAVRLAQGDASTAALELGALVEAAPRDSALRLRLADATLAAGQTDRARAVVTEAASHLPAHASVRQVARVMGLPLPLDEFRLDGKAVIREYRESRSDYAAPAVLVLDRTVARVLDDGTQVILTHNIVNVKTKDGIARWGEVEVPDAAEILALRTHKADGQVREPEEIVGKETISAPDLGPGDFVEWETIEYREPERSFAPGFVGDRFFFQSLELPLHLSEYILIAPVGLKLNLDARAQAPAPEVTKDSSTQRFRFVARKMPQLFAEPAAVSHDEWMPSVRVSSGVTVERWARMLADGLYGIARSSPVLRALAHKVVDGVDRRQNGWAAALVRWAKENIEAETGLSESATATVARGRGNRATVIVALARVLGLQADLVLARPRSEAPAAHAAVVQELDDFSEVLVRFAGVGPGAAPLYVDARWKHATLGYLHPTLDGARCLVLRDGSLETARSTAGDARTVRLDLKLEADGAGVGEVRESLRGWPAIEWAAAFERLRGDESKLRQEFEQSWLNHHFPGARLDRLAIETSKSREGEAVLRYAFSSSSLATRQGGELRIVPTFFRSQPGRRFATEGQRRTPLLIGPDPPLALETEIRLPPGATVLDSGREGSVLTGPGNALRFTETRQTQGDLANAGAGLRIVIRRQTHLPLVQVEPADYATVAGELRRIDSLEQGEIRIGLPGQPNAQAAVLSPGEER